MSSSTRSGFDLLVVLDAVVRSDASPSGMVGELAVGVKSETREAWWRVVFGAPSKTERLDVRPNDADATLLLSEEEANAILDSGAVPSEARTAEIKGDGRLAERFVARYFKQGREHSIRTH